MALGRNRRAVGTFPTRRDAEHALHELRDSGFSMDQVSVIAKDADGGEIAGADVRDQVGNKADEGAKAGAITGGTLGGITGLLVGLGALAIPGIGPVMLAGATATAIATTLSGTAIGAVTGGLLGALIGLGIPEERARVYNERVSRGEYLVIVDGTDEEIARAEAVLHRRGIEEYGVYDAPHASTTTGVTGRTDHDRVDRYDASAVGAVPTAYDATTTPHREPTDLRGRHKRAIGVFPHRRNAEAALTELRSSGFDMDKVSVIAKDADRDEIAGADVRNRVGAEAGNKADEGAKTGAATGGALGGLTGLLVGLGTLAIPGVGPIVLAGAGATALATTLAGGAIGAAAGGLGGALVGAGIPDEQAKVYNDRVSRGDYLVMVDGTDEEIRRAETILNRQGIQEFGIYDAPGVDVQGVRSDYVNPQTRAGVDSTPGDVRVVSNHPDVVIVDHRDQTL